MKKILLSLVKFFEKEEYADDFINGNLRFNRLSYFKNLENDSDDTVRGDNHEGLFALLQPKGLKINLNVKTKEGDDFLETVITESDLAGPVTMALDYHNHFHVYCMYAIQVSDFEKYYDTEEQKAIVVKEVNDAMNEEIKLDERCKSFGKYAVIVNRDRFIEAVKKYFEKEKIGISYRLVDYYDEEVFNGEFAKKDIIFSKSKKYDYQNEFRIAFNSQTEGDDPRTINIGNMKDFSLKTSPEQMGDLVKIELKPE